MKIHCWHGVRAQTHALDLLNANGLWTLQLQLHSLCKSLVNEVMLHFVRNTQSGVKKIGGATFLLAPDYLMEISKALPLSLISGETKCNYTCIAPILPLVIQPHFSPPTVIGTGIGNNSDWLVSFTSRLCIFSHDITQTIPLLSMKPGHTYATRFCAPMKMMLALYWCNIVHLWPHGLLLACKENIKKKHKMHENWLFFR